MGINRSSFVLAMSACWAAAGIASAAPQLRLSATTLGPISIATGSNGPSATIEAGNIGDGSISLSVSSSAAWLGASLGPQRACGTMQAAQCFSISLTLNTASLPQGLTTGIVNITAPGAIDAPQTLTVTVQMGGALPNDLHVSIGQGKSADYKFYTNRFLDATKTKTNADWVSVVVDGVGSFVYGVPYHLHVNTTNMPLGDYSASANLAGSSDSIDNRNVGVFIHVTDQPVGVPTVSKVSQKLAQGGPTVNGYVALDNAGLGTLSVTDVKVSNADWLKATVSGSGAALTFDAGNLAPGVYTGSISFTTNSSADVPAVPVELTVVSKGAPVINFNGVVDNAVFGVGDALTSGDIGVVLGDQFSFSPLTVGNAPPLATSVGGAQVLVNGSPAPMYYSSYSQIAFQMPFGLTPQKDVTVQVIRDGQAGNIVSAKVAARAPRILLVGVGAYGAILNQDGSIPMPTGSFPGVNTHPAQVGDTLTIYTIGLGAVSPAVAAGDPAPSTEPLSRLTALPVANFYLTGGLTITATPFFGGLAPTFAGLYQVNVTIPPDAPKGIVNLTLGFSDAISNAVQIAIQ